MQKSFFTEEQHFTSPWFWTFIIVVLSMSVIPIIVALYSQIVLGNSYGDNPASTDILLIMLAVLLITYVIVVLMFKKMRLVVEVNNDGLFYKYPPFITKERHFLKKEIRSFKIRKFKPIREYGGWGLRNGWSKSGKAYNVKGNIGLQLYLINGRKVLFGTQRGDALARVMAKMMEGK